MQDDIPDTRDRQDKTEPRATEPHIGPDHQLPPPKRSSAIRILVWVVILLAFGILFWWVLHHRQAPAAAGGGGRRAAMGGTVNLNTATAKQGEIGVYLGERTGNREQLGARARNAGAGGGKQAVAVT